MNNGNLDKVCCERDILCMWAEDKPAPRDNLDSRKTRGWTIEKQREVKDNCRGQIQSSWPGSSGKGTGMLFCATQPIFPEYLSLKTAAIPTSGHPAKAVDANERLKPRNRKNILFPSNLANPPLIINTFSRVSNRHPQETRLSLVHLMLTSNVFTTIIDNKYFTLKPNDQLGL